MTEYPLLSKAPIVEALIDIRIKLKEELQIDRLKSIHDLVSGEYPDKKAQQRWEGMVEVKAGTISSSTKLDNIHGYVFTSTDKKQILQARLDGFTFSRLKPYDKWKSFRDEALRLWEIYKKITSPEIIRVALRYINRIELPSTIKNFTEYLEAAPVIPDNLSLEINSFFNRIVTHEPKIDCIGIITQVLEQKEMPDITPIILDIDVFKTSPKMINEEEALELLEKLHNLKNDIFFKHITKKTIELCK